MIIAFIFRACVLFTGCKGCPPAKTKRSATADYYSERPHPKAFVAAKDESHRHCPRLSSPLNSNDRKRKARQPKRARPTR